MPHSADIATRLAQRHPYDALSEPARAEIAREMQPVAFSAGDQIFAAGAPLAGLYLIERGSVEITDALGETVSLLGPGNSFGERGLQRDGCAVANATVREDASLLLLHASAFTRAMEEHSGFAAFFTRGRAAEPRRVSPAEQPVSELMTADPVTITAEASIQAAAEAMRTRRISALPVVEQGALKGILTVHDLTNRMLAAGLDGSAPVANIMTRTVRTLPPEALGLDALQMMAEGRHAHVPMTRAGRLLGILSQTDLVHSQSVSANMIVSQIVRAGSAQEMVPAVAKIPELLASLTGAGTRHQIATRLIADVADAATRRLLALAEETLGLPPCPYLWLACGSQGRKEQTGLSDQDNCLILSDSAQPQDMPYFAALSRFVCDGLNTVGYVYCPGDMMATAERWCQPRAVWQGYFAKWIAEPGPEAQMLASVMFDLRPIGGDATLWEGLHAETLEAARGNSIFVSHMVSNALKHTPPLGLFRGFALEKKGAHRNTVDLKHAGVVPVTDLARIYALQGADPSVNTRARIAAAMEAGRTCWTPTI